MPVDTRAPIELTAFGNVPRFARGLVRDLRVRWALEEIGLSYRTRLLDALAPKPAGYAREQPFEQVPVYKDDSVHLFESGAILVYLGEKDERLLPHPAQPRARAIGWVFCALNSVEPAVQGYADIKTFHRTEDWAKLRVDGAKDLAKHKLSRISDWLGDNEWLEESFTLGDIAMATVLRNARASNLLNGFPTLYAYLERCEQRPAFKAALQAQLEDFAEKSQPK